MEKILLAVDDSPFSLKAAEKAAELARALEAEVTVIAVAETPAVTSFDLVTLIREKIKKETAELLVKMEAFFKEKGLQVKTILGNGHPGSIICETAEKDGFDLIVLGHRGMGKIEELLLGSVSNRVAHCAKTSVLIVK